MRGREAMTALRRLLTIAGLLLCALPKHVSAACSVTTLTLAFGNFSPLSFRPHDSVGNIAVTCTGTPGAAVRYSLVLNPGSGGTFAQRRMRLGSGATLNYNIYADAARSIVWGDGNSGSLVVADAYSLAGLSVTRNYPVYGRIFGNQNAPVGVYTDSILVTLHF